MAFTVILLTLAAGFAVLNGANNGSSLVAIATTSTSLLPITAIAVLAGGVVIGPVLFGTRVATTLSRNLVPASGPIGEHAFLAGIIAAMGVIGILAWRRLPSSLTLATVGGLAGAGFAAGLHVGWSVVLLAVLLAFFAPLATGLLTFGGSRVLLTVMPLTSGRGVSRSRLRRLRNASFTLQSLAYGTNDGQRMIAVLLVALRSRWPGYRPGVLPDTALAGVFALGTVLGTARMAHGSPGRLTPADTLERSMASTMASVAAFSSSTIGIPVSMSQTTTAALVGAHATVGTLRVRWEAASGLLGAWILTLPASAALGALCTLAIRALR